MKKLLLSCVFVTGYFMADAQQPLVVIETESGNLGRDWEVTSGLGLESISTKTDAMNSNYPGSADKLVTYTVKFPKAGTYDLFVKIKVGSGGPNDDSFYYSNGFGAKDPENAEDWVTVNGLVDAGYLATDLSAEVDDKGTAKKGQWKWINISKYISLEKGVSFKVKDGQLTQTFQIGGREDGLEIDKFVFAPIKSNYTVDILNKAE